MKRFFYLSSLMMFLVIKGYCQTPNWQWAITGGGGQFQFGSGLGASASGDLYFGGRIAGAVNLGGQAASAGGAATVVKGRFNRTGTFSWLQPYVYSGGFDYTWGFWLDAADNSYSSGTVNSGSEIFIDKMNSAGVSAWNVRVPCAGNGGGYGVTTDNAGNVYATGMISGSMNFGTTTVTSTGSWDIYLAKYNSAGVCQWAINAAAGTGYDVSRSIVCDNAGNIYLWGSYTANITFPGGTITLPNAGTYPNMFIAKYSPTGTPLWATYAIGAGITNLAWNDHTGLAIDSCENLYTCGYYQGMAQFGNITLTNAGLYDFYVAKILSNGKWEWVKGVGSTGYDGAESLVLDKNFDIYIGGFFNGTVQFGTGTGQTVTSAGLNDVFVAKYANSTGDLQWVQRGGGPDNEDASAITIDKNGCVYATGPFNATATFGPSTLTATATNNILLAKLDSIPDRQIRLQLPASYSYCTGMPLTLPYTIIGTFNSGNTFTAQLSDTNGSFQSPLTLGSTTGTGSGTITILMPTNLVVGKYYTIRIVSTSPAYSSYDYCQKILITGPCKPRIYNADTTELDTVFCFENINHPIIGIDGGGSFTGCGIVDSAGRWYFNPAVAAYSAGIFPHKCPIKYKLPTGQDTTRMMTVNRPEKVNAGPDYVSCDGNFELTALPANTGTYTFMWSPATGLSVPTQATTSGTISGNNVIYQVKIVNTETGCQAIDSVIIYYDKFDGQLITDKDTLCALTDMNASVMIVPEKTVTYSWDMGDGTTATTPTVQHTYQRIGNYAITVITKDAYCYDTVTADINVTDFDMELNVSGSDTIVEMGNTVTLQIQATQPYHVIQWRPVDLFSDQTAKSQTFAPDKAREYVVIAASDRFGCVDSARIGLRINSTVFMPDAFSPNGDGRNDYIRPLGAGEPFKVTDFKIYDRWGKQVFAAYGVTAQKGWDGRVQGQPAEMGVYFYTLEIETYSGRVVSQKGDITLLR